jgi:hypothetical protein
MLHKQPFATLGSKEIQSAEQGETTWDLRGEFFAFLGESTALYLHLP